MFEPKDMVRLQTREERAQDNFKKDSTMTTFPQFLRVKTKTAQFIEKRGLFPHYYFTLGPSQKLMFLGKYNRAR